ncbi:MAG: protein-L-isoaspartate(D-aspartate) O-methyltransferase, partial [Pseudomonadales bacterium]
MLSEIQGVGMTSMRTRERLISRLYEEGITNPKVLDCIRSLPRHLFVDEALAHRAYEDTALPIGYSQTLSQPYVVARMTELLLSRGVPERVLEIGTGSGYQTAVLSQLVKRVYTVERIAPLLEKARQRFQDLGMRNVFTRHSDGGMGWPEKGPFNAILSA